jgi:hypothetical protein
VVTDGLPPLGTKSLSPSGPREQTHGFLADCNVAEFNVVKDLTLAVEHLGSEIWSASSHGMDWSTEPQVCGYVERVLRDVVGALQLSDKVTIKSEAGVNGMRPDFWVVSNRGVPIGIVDVKRPGNVGGKSIMESRSLHGQTFAYLNMLSKFHGMKDLFGIQTTYREWRVVWPKNLCSAAAASTTVAAKTDTALSKLPDAPQWTSDAPTVRTAKKEVIGGNDDDEKTEEVRELGELGGTEIMLYDNKNLVSVLASAIWKMYNSPVSGVSVGTLDIKVTKDTWFWIPKSNAVVTFTQMPPVACVQFLLLQDLRGGTHGRVWLAASLQGDGCVIKFSRVTDISCRKRHLENEAEWWNLLWKCPARVITLCGEPALLMPYVAPLPAFITDDINSAIMGALKHVQCLGYRHGDLKREHVGLYTTGISKEIRVLFTDLSIVNTIDPDETDELANLFAKLTADE